MPYPGPSSVAPSLPSGYEWRKGATNGDLQLWKIDVTPNVVITSANIGEFDVNGSLRAAINTIYLEQAHSIKSSGEEVVFQNLESKVFYTPVWQFTSENGASVGDASVLVESPTPTNYLQNGTTATDGTSVPCEDTYMTAENGSVYEFSAISSEAYSGKLSLEVRNSLGDAVFRLNKTVSLTAGSSVFFDKLLYRVRVGNIRTFRLLKDDGLPLLVRGGSNAAKPWVKFVYRGFTDRAIVHVDAAGKVPVSQLPQIDTVERNTVANQAGRLALPVSSKFRITIQSDIQRQFYLDPNANPSVAGNWVDGGSVASAVTSFNTRTGNVTPQSGDYTAAQVGAIALPADDGVRRVLVGQTPVAESIVNNLTSTSTTSPLSAAQGKVLQDGKQGAITGAATTITASDLTASRALASNASGKVAVSNVISTELDYLSGVTSPIQAQLNNKADKAHTKRGYDLVVDTHPQFVFRDKFLTSGLANTTISAANVPWVFANIDAAESSLPYWIQELTTFFKNLENDNQFDSIIGGIPSNFSIPQGSWGVTPSGSTDMDNNVGSGTTYAADSFELIVGKNSAETEVYTFGFTFSQFANAAYDTTALHPFRIIYQTTRGVSSGFSGQNITPVASSKPRCTARSNSFTVGGYLSLAFPLMFEPITLEIKR